MFQGVSAVIERKVWKIDGILNITKKMDLKDVLNIIRTEQEKEKKRRVSMPYSSDKEITDLHIQNRTRRLSELHEELFKLFSINAVSVEWFMQNNANSYFLDCNIGTSNLHLSY